MSGSISPGRIFAGAGVSTVSHPASRASFRPRATVARSFSSWKRTCENLEKSIPSMSDSDSIMLAPGATVMAFCPSAATVIKATPVAQSAKVFTRLTSIPCPRR